MKRTSKGNFGGGNTAWEDKKLGNYLTSETRFEEIVEKMCKNSDIDDVGISNDLNNKYLNIIISYS